MKQNLKKIKQKLSEDELEYFPKIEKDLLKYCPIEIPRNKLSKNNKYRM